MEILIIVKYIVTKINYNNAYVWEQHFLGLQGMPRRIGDYPDAFAGWNLISSLGSIVSVVAAWLFLYLVYNQLVEGKVASRNPWLTPGFYTDILQANLNRSYSSLEWGLSSPPKPHAFVSLPLQSNNSIILFLGCMLIGMIGGHLLRSGILGSELKKKLIDDMTLTKSIYYFIFSVISLTLVLMLFDSCIQTVYLDDGTVNKIGETATNVATSKETNLNPPGKLKAVDNSAIKAEFFKTGASIVAKSPSLLPKDLFFTAVGMLGTTFYTLNTITKKLTPSNSGTNIKDNLPKDSYPAKSMIEDGDSNIELAYESLINIFDGYYIILLLTMCLLFTLMAVFRGNQVASNKEILSRIKYLLNNNKIYYYIEKLLITRGKSSTLFFFFNWIVLVCSIIGMLIFWDWFIFNFDHICDIYVNYKNK